MADLPKSEIMLVELNDDKNVLTIHSTIPVVDQDNQINAEMFGVEKVIKTKYSLVITIGKAFTLDDDKFASIVKKLVNYSKKIIFLEHPFPINFTNRSGIRMILG